MKKLSCQMARLIRICVRGHDGRIGVLYLIAILILGFCGIAVSLRMIAWSAAFYDALQRVDGNEILKQIGVFAALTLTSAVLYLIGRCLQQMLQIRWRTALTDEVLSRWLRNQTHWKLRLGGKGVDNPDQRIAEDCRLFAQLFITQGLGLVNELVAVVSYFSVLWSLSAFALSIRLFGASVEIPRYMVWAAPLYVLLASMLTHALGTPLRKLNLAQQKREADFRFSLGSVRESSESIALQKGERTERRILDGLYAQIVANWKLLIKRELILGCFTRPYMQTVLRIPVFLALPAFIAGKLTLGGADADSIGVFQRCHDLVLVHILVPGPGRIGRDHHATRPVPCRMRSGRQHGVRHLGHQGGGQSVPVVRRVGSELAQGRSYSGRAGFDLAGRRECLDKRRVWSREEHIFQGAGRIVAIRPRANTLARAEPVFSTAAATFSARGFDGRCRLPHVSCGILQAGAGSAEAPDGNCVGKRRSIRAVRR
ncbi:CDS102 [Achromobacter xylosoxidans]|nr:SbmA/BacA-like family transporter [Achromobacter xylosoxidans]CUJ84295.1 CDS102 [Achromobacter xylosoxidans]